MEEYQVTTIYLPRSDRLGWRDRYSDILSLETTNWLLDVVGPQAPSYLDFLSNLTNDKYQWYYGGTRHDPETLYVRSSYCVGFRCEKMAALFKLTWA